jgi:hypothetical protein
MGRHVMLAGTVVGPVGHVMHGLLGHGHRHQRPAGGSGGEHHGHSCQRAAAQGVTHRSRRHWGDANNLQRFYRD